MYCNQLHRSSLLNKVSFVIEGPITTFAKKYLGVYKFLWNTVSCAHQIHMWCTHLLISMRYIMLVSMVSHISQESCTNGRARNVRQITGQPTYGHPHCAYKCWLEIVESIITSCKSFYHTHTKMLSYVSILTILLEFTSFQMMSVCRVADEGSSLSLARDNGNFLRRIVHP